MSGLSEPLRRPLRAVRGAWHRLANRVDPPILILAYHRVAALERDPEALAVHPDRFRGQMRHLRERYRTARFEEPWPRSDRPVVVVTFDDGYADNATEALPILEEERIPATFFVTSGNVTSGEEFWWDELERHVSGPRLPAKAEIEVGSERLALSLRTDEARQAAYRTLHRKLRPLDAVHRAAALSSLRAACGTDSTTRPSHRPLAPSEVSRLGQSPWARVGAHGVTHTPFAALPIEEQRREMTESREALRGWSGTDVDSFSFPYGGKRDFTRASVDLAREAGFRRVAANMPGQVHRWSGEFLTPRFLVRDWDADRFAAEVRRFESA